MACEVCSKCGELGTPWSFSKKYNGHICTHCSYEEADNEVATKTPDYSECSAP